MHYHAYIVIWMEPDRQLSQTSSGSPNWSLLWLSTAVSPATAVGSRFFLSPDCSIITAYFSGVDLSYSPGFKHGRQRSSRRYWQRTSNGWGRLAAVWCVWVSRKHSHCVTSGENITTGLLCSTMADGLWLSLPFERWSSAADVNEETCAYFFIQCKLFILRLLM